GVLGPLGEDALPERPPRTLRRVVTIAGLPAFAGIGEAVQVVECRRNRLMAVASQRPVAHRRAAEMVLDDVERRLDFRQRHRLAALDEEEIPEDRRDAMVDQVGEIEIVFAQLVLGGEVLTELLLVGAFAAGLVVRRFMLPAL